MISVQPKYHWASTFSPEFGTPNGVHQGLARDDPFWEYKWYCAADALDTDVINPVEDHLEGIVRDRVLFDVRNELMSEEDLWPHGLEP